MESRVEFQVFEFQACDGNDGRQWIRLQLNGCNLIAGTFNNVDVGTAVKVALYGYFAAGDPHGRRC
jgi:hypothetical protein